MKKMSSIQQTILNECFIGCWASFLILRIWVRYKKYFFKRSLIFYAKPGNATSSNVATIAPTIGKNTDARNIGRYPSLCLILQSPNATTIIPFHGSVSNVMQAVEQIRCTAAGSATIPRTPGCEIRLAAKIGMMILNPAGGELVSATRINTEISTISTDGSEVPSVHLPDL